MSLMYTGVADGGNMLCYKHSKIMTENMTRQTFDYLCNQVCMILQHQDTVFRKAISVEKHVAIISDA